MNKKLKRCTKYLEKCGNHIALQYTPLRQSCEFSKYQQNCSKADRCRNFLTYDARQKGGPQKRPRFFE